MAPDSLRLRVPAGLRARQVQDAQHMQDSIYDRCKRKEIDPPNYELLELIGKGNYGRVYKGKNRTSQQICAIKIIEVDKQDYKAPASLRDDTINEFIRETTILRSLRDNNVQNVNVLYDAFSVDTQLWIISEYCPGGSLSTLIRASAKKINNISCLEEELIIPIAREVGMALKWVHAAKIIHRDIKCANILVTEDGRIQLCDFGVSGLLESEGSKRSTIIGTPHWMAPELVVHLGRSDDGVHYGTEIDCYAYGCAVHEMATGVPPNHSLLNIAHLRTMRERPKLVGDSWSQTLKHFIGFCCEEAPEDRPNASQIVQHEYIANTEQQYPIKSIQVLIERFARWEESGNQRNSLWQAAGAQGPGDTISLDGTSDDWNFSTSMEFEKRLSLGLNPFESNAAEADRGGFMSWDKLVQEQAIKRGGDAIQSLFDQTKPPYQSGSDLPLRASYEADRAVHRETIINLDDAEDIGGPPTLTLDDGHTIRARRTIRQNQEIDSEDDSDLDMEQTTKPRRYSNNNRRTIDWKFPQPNNSTARRTMEWSFTSAQSEVVSDGELQLTESYAEDEIDLDLERPKFFKSKTAPMVMADRSSELVLDTSPSRESMIDLGDFIDTIEPVVAPELVRSLTAYSTTDSILTEATNDDPFPYESALSQNNRASLHMKTQSEPTAAFRMSAQPSTTEELTHGVDVPGLGHNRSASMTRSELNRTSSTSPTRRLWRSRTADVKQTPDEASWGIFSEPEESMLKSDKRGWTGKRGHRRRVPQSQSSAQTIGSSSQGSVSFSSQALRPTRQPGDGKNAVKGKVRQPREPDKAVLLPDASRQLMEEELASMFEDLAYQADGLVATLEALLAEEDYLDSTSTLENSMTLPNEPQ